MDRDDGGAWRRRRKAVSSLVSCLHTVMGELLRRNGDNSSTKALSTQLFKLFALPLARRRGLAQVGNISKIHFYAPQRSPDGELFYFAARDN